MVYRYCTMLWRCNLQRWKKRYGNLKNVKNLILKFQFRFFLNPGYLIIFKQRGVKVMLLLTGKILNISYLFIFNSEF